jgi:hypothetical protein
VADAGGAVGLDGGDAARGGGDSLGDRLAQLGEVSDRADRLDPVVGQDRDSRRVVTAVFELLEPIQKELTAMTAADISNDAAH